MVPLEINAPNLISKKSRPPATGHLVVPVELIERRIYPIRGHKVMFDVDLGELYQVTTKRLNEAVKRNSERFPEDFMFQLTAEEAASLRSQFATSNLIFQIVISKQSGRGWHRLLGDLDAIDLTISDALFLESARQQEPN
jgi:hypothetical protein